MSKKSIVLKYQTPLEFIAMYSKKELEPEKERLEKITGKTLLELIAMLQEDKGEYWKLQNIVENFANGCGMVYCHDHEIFHEYANCPFCSLGIKMD